MVGCVGVLPAVASQLVHLVVFVGPVAVALGAVELDHLVHEEHHQLVGLLHAVHFQTNGALVVAELLRIRLGELFQTVEASTGGARRALVDLGAGRDDGAHGALEVVGLEGEATVLV